MSRGSLLAAAAAVVLVVTGCGSIGGVGGLPVLRDQADPMTAAIDEVDGCPVLTDVQPEMPRPAAIDAAIDADGGARGAVTVGEVELFWGTVEVAGFGLGGRALFLGQDGRAWLRTAPGTAAEMRSLTTPAGREVWWLEDVAESRPCG